MRRVLTSAGRVVLSVWTGDSPYFVAQREALRRFIGVDATLGNAAAYSLGSPEELHGLLQDAGLRDVVVHRVQMTLRLPVAEEFVLRHLSAGPAAHLVAAARDEARAAIVAYMQAATRAYVDGYGLAVPQEVNAATARL